MIKYDDFWPYVITNGFAVVLLILAYRRHRLTRPLFIFMFVAAGLLNIITAFNNPEVFYHYGDKVALDIYRRFIHGFFSQHTQLIVMLIALGQITVAVLLSAGKKWVYWGINGGVFFFLALVPLGMGAAFPAMLIFSVALIMMQYRME